MRNVTSLGAAALLTLTLVACGKEGGTTKNPDGSSIPGGALVDATKASEEAKKDFRAVVKKYESAKADGSVSGDECQRLSQDFMGVFKKHGKQMAIAYFNAGAIWEECGQIDKAEEIYQAMTRQVPKYDMSYNNLGVIYWNRAQEGRALDFFKKAVEVNPKTHAPRNNLAAALRDKYSNSPNQGDFDKAEGEIQRVLAVDSGNQVAYENLARLYYDRGRLKDKSYLVLANLVVTQGINVLKEEGRQSADLYNLAGLLRMQENNQVEALKAFKKAVEVDSKHSDANMNMALVSIRFRDYESAEKSLRVAMQDKRLRKDIESFLGLGVAQRGLRKYKEAEQAFRQAAKINSNDPRPLYNLGILYHEHLATREDLTLDGIKKHYTTAKDFYQQFVSKASGKKEYGETVSDAKARIDNIEESFRTWAEMAELERKAKELEELQRKQEEEERKSLLGAEERALEAAKRAEEAAKKKAEEASKAPPAAGAAKGPAAAGEKKDDAAGAADKGPKK